MSDKIKVPGPQEQKPEPKQEKQPDIEIPKDKPVSWGSNGTYKVGG